jgi:hypothetical protein
MGSVYSLCTGSGLAAVGSTKSGAMLNFSPFYIPLGNGSSLGEAYRDWWDYIASGGLTPSEKSWHLGMVLLGDPSLMPAMHILGIEGEGTGTTQLVPGLSSNPCRGSLTVSFPGSSGSVDVYDISGRLSAAGLLTDSSCTIDMSGLASGMYIVKVSSDAGEASATMILMD